MNTTPAYPYPPNTIFNPYPPNTIINPFLPPAAIVPPSVEPIGPVTIPQQPQYPTPLPTVWPSAPVSVDPLNDAFLALKLQEEEDRKKTQQYKDEEIARSFVVEEQKKRQEAADREKADTYLAQRIAAEEQQQEARRLEEARSKEAARKREEEERKGLEAEKKKKIAQDEALAKKIAEEEQKALQLRKDFELARKIDDQEKKAPTPPPSPGFTYPSVYGSSSIPVNPSAYPTFNRDHVIAIHNRYCFCGNTQPYNNNHLHSVHTTHCNCGYSLHAVQNPNSNHGRKHVHDYRCCGVNHMHTVNCYCAYRSHQHNYMCCSLNHKHDEYCHCCSK